VKSRRLMCMTVVAVFRGLGYPGPTGSTTHYLPARRHGGHPDDGSLSCSFLTVATQMAWINKRPTTTINRAGDPMN
jgi:hypothetical protein